VLADALGRELVVKTTSDLVSKYVGETERNLAALFTGLDAERSVLFLDEVDSLLRDRREARHSWETTQVNELLQQMERFPGIFIAATNLMDGLDAAALRRFDFKLHFRPWRPPSGWRCSPARRWGAQRPSTRSRRCWCASCTAWICSRRATLPTWCGSARCSARRWRRRISCAG
jgi:hypothetical protein